MALLWNSHSVYRTGKGLTTGSAAPDFALPDPLTGTATRLSDLSGRDALIVFLRGTWCPFCQEQLRFLKGAYPALSAANIAVVAISCQSAASVQRYVEKNPLPFPLLADAAREAAKAYGVHYYLSLEGFNLANPSLFIVDGAGLVVFCYVGKNMADLPVQAILERFIGFLGDSPDGNAKTG